MAILQEKVAIVVDPEFGDQVADLIAKIHVWIVDSPSNRVAVKAIWCKGQKQGEGQQFTATTFTVDFAATRVDWCAGILEAVDLHHGEYSNARPYSVIEVYGISIDKRLQAHFGEFGFTIIEETEFGFVASVPTT